GRPDYQDRHLCQRGPVGRVENPLDSRRVGAALRGPDLDRPCGGLGPGAVLRAGGGICAGHHHRPAERGHGRDDPGSRHGRPSVRGHPRRRPYRAGRHYLPEPPVAHRGAVRLPALALALLLGGCTVTLPPGNPPSHHDVAQAEQQAGRSTVACPITTFLTLVADALSFGASQVAFLAAPEAVADSVGMVTGNACLGKSGPPIAITIKWPWE